YAWSRPGSENPVPKLSFVKRFAEWGWIVGTGIYVDDIDAEVSRSARAAATMALTCLAVLIVVSVTISRSIFGRLSDMAARIRDVAQGEGDVTRRIEVTREDEIGELAKWFNVFMDKLQALVQSIADAAQQVSVASGQVSETTEQIASNARETSGQVN